MASLVLRTHMFQQRMIGVGLLVVLSVLPAPALGRTWSNAAGTSQLEGELVEARADGTVLIKRSDGKMLEVKLDRLSQADQDFVRQQAAAPPPTPRHGCRRFPRQTIGSRFPPCASRCQGGSR